VVRLIIIPIFALANAGVALGTGTAAAATSPIALGIVLGLVVGKLMGIFCMSWLAVRLGRAVLPTQVDWRQSSALEQSVGSASLYQSSFAGLAFAGQPLLEIAKLGIFAGSLVAGGTSFLLLFKFAARIIAASVSSSSAVSLDARLHTSPRRGKDSWLRLDSRIIQLLVRLRHQLKPWTACALRALIPGEQRRMAAPILSYRTRSFRTGNSTGRHRYFVKFHHNPEVILDSRT
jgi:Na+/H+ antiporter 1